MQMKQYVIYFKLVGETSLSREVVSGHNRDQAVRHLLQRYKITMSDIEEIEVKEVRI
jgi:ribosomal protein L20A (L18A)